MENEDKLKTLDALMNQQGKKTEGMRILLKQDILKGNILQLIYFSEIKKLSEQVTNLD